MVEQKLEGESYSQIKAELAKLGLSQKDISEAIKTIDDKVLRAEIEHGSLARSKQFYRVGLILAVIGLVVTIGSNAGFLFAGISKLIIYSPFIAGIMLMVYARILQRQHPDPFEKGPGRIRGKRPNKW